MVVLHDSDPLRCVFEEPRNISERNINMEWLLDLGGKQQCLIGCYYFLFGIPLGLIFGYLLHMGVQTIDNHQLSRWSYCGTAKDLSKATLKKGLGRQFLNLNLTNLPNKPKYQLKHAELNC
ncbi:hypothetical protein H6P81_012610 [Aristolochia fimbriata]|uniref:Uncharacterized protein n=1 Tax=Aristolochia fimbriata TaxID=158543 RepID=A0AAV7ECB6_ARIFI|nr:hypothetical protein H6P81_012610 [Aristolochia fimbriata]